MKLFRILLELAIIACCFWLTNRFVEEVMVPDYTQGWQTREEWEASGRIGGVPRDANVYRCDIERKRNVDRGIYFFLLLCGVGGYYGFKGARRELKRAAGFPAGSPAKAESNRKVMSLRMGGLMGLSVCVTTWLMCMLSVGIIRGGEPGLTYLLGGIFKDSAAILLIIMMIGLIGMGPWVMLRGIRPISFRSCLLVTIGLAGCSGILWMLKLDWWVILLIDSAMFFVPGFRKPINEIILQMDLAMKGE